jgi:hypothetical protein
MVTARTKNRPVSQAGWTTQDYLDDGLLEVVLTFDFWIFFEENIKVDGLTSK